MKKYFYFAAVASIALASCSSEEFLGEAPASPVSQDGAILFRSSTSGATRAEHIGSDAANLLHNQFVVAGFKGGDGTIATPAAASVTTTKVFDHYYVNWAENTASTTESNTADWEYVGQQKDGATGGLHAYATTNGISAQTIKYWDYSTAQYDFIAYSVDKNVAVYNAAADGKLFITPINSGTATTAAYTVAGATNELKDFYIADLVTVTKGNYGKEVQLKFRNLSSKVRVGLYETVPGYSIKDVKFYTSDEDDAQSAGSSATLYAADATMAKKGTYTVYYPVVNTTTIDATHLASDMNKAHVTFAADGTQDSYQSYGNLDYVREQSSTKITEKYLGTSSNTATYATNSSTKPYTNVLPNETAGTLTLRCDYTLVSDDGSKETITIHGAKAIVPAIYCQWKSNYAYTYLFKISDKTNGSTEKLGGTEGLTPITFDAIVTETEDGIQETITTVATPSITTYSKGKIVTENDEYTAAPVYVMVQNGTTLKNDLNTKGKLYTVDASASTAGISEATIHDALTIGATTSGSVTTGRNKIALTDVTTGVTYPTAVAGADDNNITVPANTTALFTAATGTYAYVYETTSGTPTTTKVGTAIKLTGASAPADFTTAYYTDKECATLCVAGNYVDGGTYYHDPVTNTNKTYAVKVIKVQ